MFQINQGLSSLRSSNATNDHSRNHTKTNQATLILTRSKKLNNIRDVIDTSPSFRIFHFFRTMLVIFLVPIFSFNFPSKSIILNNPDKETNPLAH